jgi:hypothetical protein
MVTSNKGSLVHCTPKRSPVERKDVSKSYLRKKNIKLSVIVYDWFIFLVIL